MSRETWGLYGKCAPRPADPGSHNDLDEELIRGRRKFPGNRFLLAALQEEVGELAKALLQKESAQRTRAEALQVASVALRIAEEGDASFVDITDEEAKK